MKFKLVESVTPTEEEVVNWILSSSKEGTVSISDKPYKNGASFILSDGRSLCILDENETHGDIQLSLGCHLNNSTAKESGSQNEDDGINLTENVFGWIHANAGDYYTNNRSYVKISKLPTQAQCEALDEWLYSCSRDKLFVNCSDKGNNAQTVDYPMDECPSWYVVNRIKRYYSSGTLYEEKQLDK